MRKRLRGRLTYKSPNFLILSLLHLRKTGMKTIGIDHSNDGIIIFSYFISPCSNHFDIIDIY